MFRVWDSLSSGSARSHLWRQHGQSPYSIPNPKPSGPLKRGLRLPLHVSFFPFDSLSILPQDAKPTTPTLNLKPLDLSPSTFNPTLLDMQATAFLLLRLFLQLLMQPFLGLGLFGFRIDGLHVPVLQIPGAS